MSKHKQCPFCGSIDLQTTTIKEGWLKGWYVVLCQRCWTYGPPAISIEAAYYCWDNRWLDESK